MSLNIVETLRNVRDVFIFITQVLPNLKEVPDLLQPSGVAYMIVQRFSNANRQS